jgi:hypothetical protein
MSVDPAAFIHFSIAPTGVPSSLEIDPTTQLILDVSEYYRVYDKLNLIANE